MSGLARRIRTVTDLKLRASRILKELAEERRPIIITQEGVPRAVILDVESYDGLEKSLVLLKLVAQSEEAIRKGRTRKNSEVFAKVARKHGLKHGPRRL